MIKPEDFENERVIWQAEICLKPHKIPEGNKKCPDCQGSGRQVKIYKDPGPNETMTCFTCMGKGYVKTSVANGENKQ